MSIYYIILLKSRYYNTPAPACFGPHWYIVREHTVVQNSCLVFSACSRAAEKSSLINIYVVDRVKYSRRPQEASCSNYYGQCTTRSTTHILLVHNEEFSSALLHVENIKKLFCTTAFSLITYQ